MKNKIVVDKNLGEIFFPEEDEVISCNIRDNGVWEQNEINWMKKNVSIGNTCLNIGANIGYHSMLLSNLVGETGKVYAFEPSRSVFPFLKKNISSKKIKNVFLIKSAIGNINGEIKIYINNKNFGDNRCFNPRDLDNLVSEHNFGFIENKVMTEKVKIKRIDDLFQNKKIDIMVIDTQGYDMLVIDGARNVIESNMPKILTEFTPEWNNFLQIDYMEIFNWMISLGYRIYNIDDSFEDITNNIYKKIKETNFYINISFEKKY